MYQLTQNPNSIRRGDAFIPTDPANADYAEYLAWVAAGNTPDPYIVPPAPVPTTVSRFQARAALHAIGMLGTVEALMTDPATPFLARLAWKEVVQFDRDSPTIAAMAALLPLTTEQLDALFIAASNIRA